jgi:hypothetical protein
MRLLDLSRAGETGAKRMAGERALALPFGEIAAHARLENAFLHEPRDMLVGKPLGGDARLIGPKLRFWPSWKTFRECVLSD